MTVSGLPILSAGLFLFQKFEHLLPRARVDDVALLRPSATSLSDAPLHITQFTNCMRIGINTQPHAQRQRRTNVLVVQIEPPRMRVDFHNRMRALGRLQERLYIHRVAGAAPDETAGGMKDDMRIRILHGADKSLRLYGFG